MRKYQVCSALLVCALAACTAHPGNGADVPVATSSASPARRLATSPPSAPVYTNMNWNSHRCAAGLEDRARFRARLPRERRMEDLCRTGLARHADRVTDRAGFEPDY